MNSETETLANELRCHIDQRVTFSTKPGPMFIGTVKDVADDAVTFITERPEIQNQMPTGKTFAIKVVMPLASLLWIEVPQTDEDESEKWKKGNG